MKAPIAAVLVIGAALGMLMPGEGTFSHEQKPSEVAAVVNAPKKAAPRRAGWGQETRLKPGANGHFHATALINGQPVETVVDTGATVVALTVSDARRIGIAVNESSFGIVGSGAGGPVRGQEVTLRSVSVDGKEVRTVSGVVLEGLDISLLGQTYLSRISEVKMSGSEMILR